MATATSPSLELEVLSGTLVVHRFSPETPLPKGLTDESLYFIGKTENELSIVCSDRFFVKTTSEDHQIETGWRALRVKGPLDFGLIGILAKIGKCLADAQVSIFALSTFDTDIILVKQEKIHDALKALRQAGYTVPDTA
jgi:hypothetical protein